MPLYEYKCTACGHQLEVLQRASASAPKCPDCGADPEYVKKLVSLSSFALKGSGWAKDGYTKK